MPKRAQTQIRKRIQAAGKPEQIDQLCLDGIEIKNISSNIKKMLESCNNLEYLTLNDCKLRSLQNFPQLRKLIVLELSDNELSGDDFTRLSCTPAVNFLTLDGNKIQAISNIQLLTCLPDLQILQVHDNSISESFDYRETIFGYLPKLTAVDCQDRQGNRVEEEDPSEYISYREPRSNINLSDLLDDQDQKDQNMFIQKTSSDYIVQRETSASPGGSLYVGQQNNHARPAFNIMNIRTSIQDGSDSQDDKDLYRDFRKKIFKKQ